MDGHRRSGFKNDQPRIFTNGRSPARVEAELHPVDKGLEIRDPRDNILLALWSYADLSLVKRLKPGAKPKKLQITCAKDPEARLLIDDPPLILQLQKLNRGLKAPRKSLPVWLWWAAAGSAPLVLVLLVLGFVVAAARPLSGVLPISWESALGEAFSLQMGSHYGGYCHNPGWARRPRRHGGRLAPAGSMAFPVVLRVIKSPEVNAFGLPAGRVVLTSGLVNDAEFRRSGRRGGHARAGPCRRAPRDRRRHPSERPRPGPVDGRRSTDLTGRSAPRRIARPCL